MIRRGYADTPEGQVHFLTQGDGEPLLLLHQSPRSARMYADLIPHLSKQYRVVAMDTLGCGGSDPPPADVQISDLARCAAHFLDSVGITKAHVFGLHTGAVLGAELAAAHPGKVGALAFFGYTFVESEAEREALLASLQTLLGRLTEVSADGAHLPRLWAWAYNEVVNMWWNTGTAPTREPPPEVMRFLDRWMLDFLQARENARYITTALFKYDSPARLPLVKAPTLHIQGDSRFEVPLSLHGARVARLIPRCETMVLPQSDANAAEWRAVDLAEAVHHFLRKHPL